MRDPRTCWSAVGPSASRSSPWKRIEPPVTRPLASRARITANASDDFPEPLSPTSATVSPAATARLAPRTACTTPAGVAYATERSHTSRIGASLIGALPRHQPLPEPVAEEVDADDQRHDRA